MTAHGDAQPSWYPLLQALAAGDWLSGSALAERLGVSRAAVWKQIESLQGLGLDIERRKGKGYRLSQPLELLSARQIESHLGDDSRAACAEIEVLAEVDSTNTRLLRAAAAGAPSGSICIAERQLAGRGRRGRDWVSRLGAGLYLSLLWRFDQGLAAIGGLSLAVGVAAGDALRDHGVDVQLKWPNDLLLGDAKLGGILIEGSGEAGGAALVVIGVGINCRLPADIEIDQPSADLGAIPVSRNQLAADLCAALIGAARTFERHGLAPFLSRWRDCDALAGRPITITVGEERLTGICAGVDETGRLLLDTDGGQRAIAGGDVSVLAR